LSTGFPGLEGVRCEELEWKITHSINPRRGRVPKEPYLIKVRGNNSSGDHEGVFLLERLLQSRFHG